MQVQTYLYFDGKCEEAIDFYKDAVGAKVDILMRFKENPDPNMPSNPAHAEKIMHAQITIGETIVLLSDGQCGGTTKFDGFCLSLICPNVDEARRLFAAVGEGGNTIMPLMETFFSPLFGMTNDKFGVNWMVLVEKKM